MTASLHAALDDACALVTANDKPEEGFVQGFTRDLLAELFKGLELPAELQPAFDVGLEAVRERMMMLAFLAHLASSVTLMWDEDPDDPHAALRARTFARAREMLTRAEQAADEG